MKNFKSAIAIAMGVFTLSPCHSTEKTYGSECGDFSGLECLPSASITDENQIDFYFNYEPILIQSNTDKSPKYMASMEDLEIGRYLHGMHLLTNQGVYANKVDEILESAYIHLLAASNYPHNLEAKMELNNFKIEMARNFPNYRFSHII